MVRIKEEVNLFGAVSRANPVVGHWCPATESDSEFFRGGKLNDHLCSEVANERVVQQELDRTRTTVLLDEYFRRTDGDRHIRATIYEVTGQMALRNSGKASRNNNLSN